MYTQPQKNSLHKKLFGLLISIFISLAGFSQNVSISAKDTLPNAAAGLDVYFSTKGLLIPRVALTSTLIAAPLSAHVNGMIIYNTATAGDVKPGFYYDDGTKWITGFPVGANIGDMLFWNGLAWAMIPVGSSGQNLVLSASNIPVWAGVALASITTKAVTAVIGSNASSGGDITSDGGLPIISRGVCWNTVTLPTIANTKTTDGVGIGSFTSSLTGLLPGTTYFVRAYTINSSTINYGNEISFAIPGLAVLAPTNAATLITGTSATCGGNVTNTGGTSITEWGLCYGTALNPDLINNSKLIVATPTTGSFSGIINGLTGNTLYHVRSYAINITGTTYGTDISFTTLANLPIVVTTPAINIGATTATAGATFTINGTGGYVMAEGVAYSLIPNGGDANRQWGYDVNNSKTSPVTVNFTGLLPNTTYYIVGWVNYMNTVTSVGYSERGQEISFTTALLETSPITTVTGTTAVSGGNIGIVTGTTSINQRGVCWSTSTGPTTSLTTKTLDGSGTGVYTSSLSGLTPGTTYFVRAYCTDNIGVTTYGNEYTFSTVPIAIGDVLYGGKVVYIDGTGQHGLIGALDELVLNVNYGTPYGCYGSTSGAFGTAIYSGLANTNLIISKCGTSTAAGLCSAYSVGGKNIPGVTNWYLPALYELKAMIDANILGLDRNEQLQGSRYWTSTEDSTNPTGVAFYMYSVTYTLNATEWKDQNRRVRAVRAF